MSVRGPHLLRTPRRWNVTNRYRPLLEAEYTRSNRQGALQGHGDSSLRNALVPPWQSSRTPPLRQRFLGTSSTCVLPGPSIPYEYLPKL